MEKKIKIGTSGFSFQDWKGIIYPERISQARMLEYYSRHLGFNAVEINSSYYQIPSEKNMRHLVEKTPSDFTFTIKAFRGITHDPFDNRLDKKPDINQIEDYLSGFKQAVLPLAEAGKFGAILFQFPVFFYPSIDAKDYILKLREYFSDFPVVLEFRNISWANEKHYNFLRHHNLGFCAVDEPKIPRLMPLCNVVTSDIAYLRCHGRNPNWFNATVSERYNYNYSQQELEEIKEIAQSMIQTAQVSFIFFNNCHAGYAAKNAMKFASMLGLKLNVDETLL